MNVLANQIIPLANYPTGTIHIGFGPGQGGNPLQVPDATRTCDIQIECCTSANPSIWPDAATTIEVIPEVSVDGGVTWIESGRAKRKGGIAFKKDGVTEEQWFTSGGSLPPGTNRLYHCTFIIVNGPAHTDGNVIVD